MQQIHRPAVDLPSLADGTTAADKHKINVENWTNQGDAFTPALPSHWRKPDILGALYAMQYRTCAYCHGTLTQSDRGDVEHFRPKSIYWWLAYSYQNYLLSCRRCNSVRKRTKFPLVAGAQPTTYPNRVQLQREARLLIDPVEDSPETWLEWILKNTLCYVRVHAGLQQNSMPWQRVEETIDFFQLNENPLLVEERTDAIFEALEKASQGDPQSTEKARKMASRYSPHGLAVRRIVGSRFPAIVPDPLDETRWLVEDLLNDLRLYESMLQEYPNSKDTKAVKKIVTWALATLWKDPPAAVSPQQVETWITKAHRLNEVKAFYDEC